MQLGRSLDLVLVIDLVHLLEARLDLVKLSVVLLGGLVGKCLELLDSVVGLADFIFKGLDVDVLRTDQRLSFCDESVRLLRVRIPCISIQSVSLFAELNLAQVIADLRHECLKTANYPTNQHKSTVIANTLHLLYCCNAFFCCTVSVRAFLKPFSIWSCSYLKVTAFSASSALLISMSTCYGSSILFGFPMNSNVYNLINFKL